MNILTQFNFCMPNWNCKIPKNISRVKVDALVFAMQYWRERGGGHKPVYS